MTLRGGGRNHKNSRAFMIANNVVVEEGNTGGRPVQLCRSAGTLNVLLSNVLRSKLSSFSKPESGDS